MENNTTNDRSSINSLFSKYNRNRRNRPLPVLKTDKDLEAEGLARLSIDLPNFQVTDEADRPLTSSPSTSEIAHAFASRTEGAPAPAFHRPKLDEHGGFANRHSVGFDVPGAVHTIVTPSQWCKSGLNTTDTDPAFVYM